MAKTVLVVDDDPTQRRLLQAVIAREGFEVAVAPSGEAALDHVASAAARVDLVLLDLVMPGLGGMATLEELAKRRPELPVVVLTAQGGIETVVEAMRAGAKDFFVKPASPERIRVSIENALKVGQLEGEVARLKRAQTGQVSFRDMIAGAPAMRQVVRLGERAAGSNIPILITGESGTGKELVARAIQGVSARAGRPFVTVNCGAIPEHLVESILFGHVKGAFTGAVDNHQGKFKEADGGTLFLDEVGELPLEAQVKLLRVLQEGEVDPVGAKRPVKVDVRIISATNRDLAEEVRQGRFREDLFYRLNVFPIETPPLRQRKEDIPALAEHFIARFNAQEGRRVKSCAPATLAMLTAFDWPGNVRQLENAIFRAVVLAEGELLSPRDFPHISGLAPELADFAADIAVETGESEAAVEDARFVYVVTDEEGGDAPPPPVRVLDESGHLRTLEAIERDLIQFAIDTYSGHMSEVARRLGIGRSTLYRKVREHDLEVCASRSG